MKECEVFVRVPLLAWIFQVIPESIALAALVMSLGTRDLPWGKIFKIGFVYAIAVYIVRIMPFTPGVHVIVLAATLGVICIYLGGLEMKRGMVYSAIGMALLVITEMVCVYTIISLKIFTMEQMMIESVISRIIGGTPHYVLLFIYALIVKKKRISLEFLFRPRVF